MADKTLKRRKVITEEAEEEKVVELFTLPKRRAYFQESIGELSEFVEKFLVKGATEKAPGLSYFAYFFANLPSTRHETHWQLQSFVLLELLQEVKLLREELKQQQKQSRA